MLQRPVGMLCHAVQALPEDASLRLAAERFATEGLMALPVLDHGLVAGVLLESDLAKALATGLDVRSAVSSIPFSQIPRLYASSTSAEALRVFIEKGCPAILVVDAQHNLVGMLTPANLFPGTTEPIRPRALGGMATPMGVHLTTGSQSAGAPWWSLVMTGAVMLLIFLAADLCSHWTGVQVAKLFSSPQLIPAIEGVLVSVLFLVGIRSLPLAGYHAAEHMVVHAIERGEDLDIEIVSRMPRVHPRCGTNLAVAVSLFLGISSAPWISQGEVRVLVALLVTLFFWKPIGEFVQLFFTTRPPNRRQLEAGIKAGKDLLHRYQTAPIVNPTPFGRIVHSGMLWVMLGSFGMSFLIEFFAQLLGFGSVIGVS